jgi:isocitrate lyase
MSGNNGNGNGNSNHNGNRMSHIFSSQAVDELTRQWAEDARWRGITRPYSAADVVRLRGTLHIEYTLARRGADRLWQLLNSESYIPALGAITGNQAVQMVQAGLKAIYISGWQVAADSNNAGQMYPDLSLYPSDSVPNLCRRINNAFLRADQIQHSSGGGDGIDWFVPLVADAEAGFGGNLNAFEVMKGMIEAGAAGVHFEDQLSSAKKCGHMGGKVLVPTQEAVQKLIAARLASDVLGVPTLLIARTDADSAKLLTSAIDPRDRAFITGARTPEGFCQLNGGTDAAIARAIAYAPYADLLWCETSHPDMNEAKRFAEAVRRQFPSKMLAYNCSPSFNWRRHLDDSQIAAFQRELGAMGYKFQFITLAGFHALNFSMFNLARAYAREGMTGYCELQEREFLAEPSGYRATSHQRFVGTGYFDEVAKVIAGGEVSTGAFKGSTEEEQFMASSVPVNAA